MARSTVTDNQLILQRAADSCRDLDDLRSRLHAIQKRLAKTRENPTSSPAAASGQPARDEALTGLLHEAYTLQFQISTLLAATEEPIPERQRIPKQQQANPSDKDPSNPGDPPAQTTT